MVVSNMGKVDVVPCPRDNAGLLSRCIFWWFNPMIKLALKKKLHAEDLPDVPANLSAAYLGCQLERAWDNSQPNLRETITKECKSNSLVKMVAILFFWTAFAVSTGQVIFILMKISSAILLQQLLIKDSSSTTYAYVLIFGLAVFTIIESICICVSVYYGSILGLKLRVSLTMLIYKKIIWLKLADLPENYMAQVLNIFTNDVASFNERLRLLSGVIVGPLSLVLNTALMWSLVGWYTLFGFFYLVLYICYQFASGKYLIRLRKKLAVLKGNRIEAVLNVLHGIKLIKMYAWEKHFKRLVAQARKKELFSIGKLLHHRIAAATMFNINGRLVFILIILPYLFLGNRILPEYIFPTFACCNILRATVVIFITTSITSIADGYVALQRIQDILELCEKRIKQKVLNSCTYHQVEFGAEMLSEKLQRNGDVYSRKVISFTAKPGDLIGIVGKVGSGKTLLLMNLLKEVEFFEGNLKINGKLAYVPQEPWIFSGTIQENILFGQPYDKTKLTNVLGACALLEDIENLYKGIETYVGEKGVNLSGGQKTRINMARAIYSDADILLLDDPFSAVDIKVGKHLFENCIRNYLNEKIVFLTTHHTQYLQDIKQTILIENGYSMLKDINYVHGIDMANSSIIKESEALTLDSSFTSAPLKHVALNQVNVMEISGIRLSEASPKLVSFKIHWKYFAGESSPMQISLCFLLVIVFLGLGTTVDIYLRNLSSDAKRTEDLRAVYSIGALFGETYQNLKATLDFYNSYCLIGIFVGSIVSTYATLLICGQIFQKSSKGLHKKMLDCTLRAKPTYFQMIHIGRFVDCFTIDTGVIDLYLPASVIDVIGYIVTLLTSLIVMSICNQWIMIPSALLLFIFVKLCIISSNVSTNFRQHETSTRSLLYSNVATTLAGLPVIHALKKEDFMIETFETSLNRHCAASYYTTVCSCWNQTKNIANTVLNSILILVILAAFIREMSSETIGLITTSIFMLVASSVFGTIEIHNAEEQMHAVENVFCNSKLESEASLQTASSQQLPPTWPSKGDILLKDVSVWYTKEQAALEGLSVAISDKEKIGIVGRTGSGKSSLINALLRWVEPVGQIEIDGVTINEIGLHDLRSKVSIITQEPILFNGSVRSNLDPFGSFSDEDLFQALNDVQMLNIITNMPESLSTNISDTSTLLSFGEKQLICLARVILRKNRILLLDEATANIDKRTDSIIQQTIREKFKDCTVLTIAHRLETIMDSDRVLVLHNGQVVEFDEPYALLKETSGHLFRLLQSAGKSHQDLLLKMAKTSHDKRNNIPNASFVSNVM